MKYDLLLFDLGGVIVELVEIPEFLSWIGWEKEEEAFWAKWVSSHISRDYESGKLNTDEFIHKIITDFELTVEKPFLTGCFSKFIKGFYPGALEVLASIPDTYRTAVLSNTNPIHWEVFSGELTENTKIGEYFLSYEIGLLKPDGEAFRHVIEKTGCAPEKILFFDDNARNIEAAEKAGIKAVQVEGPVQLKKALLEYGVLR